MRTKTSLPAIGLTAAIAMLHHAKIECATRHPAAVRARQHCQHEAHDTSP